MGKKNKTAGFYFRITDEDKNSLNLKAKEYGVTISEFILQQTLGKKTVYKQKEIIRELENIAVRDNKVDNNINQIAKILNTNYKNFDNIMIKDLYKLLDKYIKSQEELSKNIRSMYRLLSQ
ncbi:MAG: hypothetical protein Q4G63_04440 [Bacteroidia bacterium]|nr:hypothetical protein [Bacteroidia bacterium]